MISFGVEYRKRNTKPDFSPKQVFFISESSGFITTEDECFKFDLNKNSISRVLNTKNIKICSNGYPTFLYKNKLCIFKNKKVKSYKLPDLPFELSEDCIFDCNQNYLLVYCQKTNNAILIDYHYESYKKIELLTSVSFVSDLIFTSKNTLVFLDIVRHQVIEFNYDGKVLNTFGVPYQPKKTKLNLNSPMGIKESLYPNFLIADSMNNRVMEVNIKSNRVIFEYGSYNIDIWETGTLHFPTSVDKYNDKYIISDNNNSRCLIVNKNGIIIYKSHISRYIKKVFAYPRKVVKYKNTFVIADTQNNRILKLNPEKKSYNILIDNLYWPRSCFIYNDLLIIANSLNNEIVVICLRNYNVVFRYKFAFYTDIHDITVCKSAIIFLDSFEGKLGSLENMQNPRICTIDSDLLDPHSIDTKGDNAIVTDSGNDRVKLYQNFSILRCISTYNFYGKRMELKFPRIAFFISINEFVIVDNYNNIFLFCSFKTDSIKIRKIPVEYCEIMKNSRSALYSAEQNALYVTDYNEGRLIKWENFLNIL